MSLLRLIVLSLVVCACAGTETAPPEHPEAPALAIPEPPPPARDAADIARRVVGAKLGVLIHMDRVRTHPLAPRLAKMAAFGPVFEGTGIEPLRDVERAFVAAANARDGKKVIAVAEHNVPPDRVRSALESLIDRSEGDGGWLEGYAIPAARVSVRGKQSVVLAVSEHLLVVTSEPLAQAALALSKSGGLPEPDGPAALVAAADQPSDSLNAGRMPPIPKTVSRATAEVRLLADGGANVAIVGQSESPEQATEDAAELTRAIDDATSMKVSVVRIRMFEAIKFHADGSQIKGNRALSRGELEMLLGLLETLASRAQ